MNAQKITRQSGSNLALAFVSLGPKQRRDITTFYAFCRIVDDIADAPDLPVEEKRRQLEEWRDALVRPFADEPPLASEVRDLYAKYRITAPMLCEIIDGVEMDLTISHYDRWDDLRLYCYRVASAVGLVSIEIFGYRNPLCRDYAIELGLALQTTNIIRDVGKDLANGRVYLPREDLRRFNYTENDLRERIYDERFVQLMQFEAAWSHEFFERAAALLPDEDRRAMVAAETMSAVYRDLLERMERDRFRVFETDYRLTKWQKALHVVRENVKSFRMRGGKRPSALDGAH